MEPAASSSSCPLPPPSQHFRTCQQHITSCSPPACATACPSDPHTPYLQNATIQGGQLLLLVANVAAPPVQQLKAAALKQGVAVKGHLHLRTLDQRAQPAAPAPLRVVRRVAGQQLGEAVLELGSGARAAGADGAAAAQQGDGLGGQPDAAPGSAAPAGAAWAGVLHDALPEPHQLRIRQQLGGVQAAGIQPHDRRSLFQQGLHVGGASGGPRRAVWALRGSLAAVLGAVLAPDGGAEGTCQQHPLHCVWLLVHQPHQVPGACRARRWAGRGQVGRWAGKRDGRWCALVRRACHGAARAACVVGT